MKEIWTCYSILRDMEMYNLISFVIFFFLLNIGWCNVFCSMWYSEWVQCLGFQGQMLSCCKIGPFFLLFICFCNTCLIFVKNLKIGELHFSFTSFYSHLLYAWWTPHLPPCVSFLLLTNFFYQKNIEKSPKMLIRTQ